MKKMTKFGVQHGISLCFPHRSLPLTNYVTSRLNAFFEAVRIAARANVLFREVLAVRSNEFKSNSTINNKGLS